MFRKKVYLDSCSQYMYEGSFEFSQGDVSCLKDWDGFWQGRESLECKGTKRVSHIIFQLFSSSSYIFSCYGWLFT